MYLWKLSQVLSARVRKQFRNQVKSLTVPFFSRVLIAAIAVADGDSLQSQLD